MQTHFGSSWGTQQEPTHFSTIWGSGRGTDATEFAKTFSTPEKYPGQNAECAEEKERMRKEIAVLRAENDTLRSLCNKEGIRWQQEIYTTRLRQERREKLKKMGCLGWC
jgi:hypothetical protein